MPDSIAFTIFGWPVRWYGIIIALGVLAAFMVSYLRCKNRKMNLDRLLDVVLVAFLCGIVGARLYYVLFEWSYYSQHLSEIIAVWHGGLAIHGGIIGGIIGLAIYMHLKKDSLVNWLDLLAPGVLLAQGIGRWGNFFNQEAYGRVTDLPWAMMIDGAYRHPTFLYESIWNVCGFIILLLLGRSKKLKAGDTMAGYFIIYSIGRFFIESLRMDSLSIGAPLQGIGLTIAQTLGMVNIDGCLRVAMLMSLIGVVVGVAIIIFNRVRKNDAPDLLK